MTVASVPWLELSIVVPLLGALAVARVRDPYAARAGASALPE